MFDVIVTDNTKPNITCPESVQVNAWSNLTTVTWDDPVVTDNVDTKGLLATCSPGKESPFEIGLTNVTCTIFDTAGNNETCMFDVIVTDCTEYETTGFSCSDPTTENQIVNDFKEFEMQVFSQLEDIKINKELVFEEKNYVGLAKVQKANGSELIRGEMNLYNESNMAFTLEIQSNKEVDLLVIATWSYNQITKNKTVNESVYINELKEDKAEFRYLTEMFSCSVYIIGNNIIKLKASLNFHENKTLLTEIGNRNETICLFYDENKRGWSDRGMTTNNTKDRINCSSDHITSFGVFMKISNSPEPLESNKGLRKLSKICIYCSLIALSVTLGTYCYFSELWKSQRNSIHKNLVINLILMQFLFLFGIEKTEYKTACKIISIFLHLTSLNAFTWMCGEAVYLYFKVSPKPSRHNRLRYYMFLCYGIPLVIVFCTSVARSVVGTYIQNICWLESTMRWAFIAPAILIITINTVVMGIVVNVIYKRSKTMVGKSRGETLKSKQMRKAAKGTAMLLPIMGTTWLIGPFLLTTPVMEYLFVLLNGSQGIFIFFVYCVFDKEVKECFQKRNKNRVSSSATTMTMSHTV
ncbi:adhesion G protein-coupled receptor L4-like [Antedon mediterranea]|uniref:adhesion G protein-coupled receptor L4-like n=1 Tax=Antedon mediterranea TaxID=105859 RepID=UPI003AF40B7A